MKRGIRDSKEPAQEGAQVQELYEAYRGKSEDELMAELSRMSASERAQLDTLAKERIDHYFKQGLACLEAIKIDAERKEQLTTYVYKLMKRNY